VVAARGSGKRQWPETVAAEERQQRLRQKRGDGRGSGPKNAKISNDTYMKSDIPESIDMIGVSDLYLNFQNKRSYPPQKYVVS
jgi:hypothetical protein